MNTKEIFDKIICVDDEKTVVVRAKTIDQAYVVSISGISRSFTCCLKKDLNNIVELCKKNHYSTDYFFTDIDDTGVAYIKPNIENKTGMILAIRELSNRLKLDVLHIKDIEETDTLLSN